MVFGFVRKGLRAARDKAAASLAKEALKTVAKATPLGQAFTAVEKGLSIAGNVRGVDKPADIEVVDVLRRMSQDLEDFCRKYDSVMTYYPEAVRALARGFFKF